MELHEFTDEAINYILQALEDQTHTSSGKPLSAWEFSFIESVTDQWARYKRLSDKQKEVLGSIWEKI
jgi:IS1 family transposase